MEQPDVVARLNGVRESAEALLRQGERLALTGHTSQAKELLAEVWRIAKSCDQDLANLAAWDITWLLIDTDQFQEAGEWFDRVTAPPGPENALWSTAKQAIIRLCALRVRSREVLGNETPSGAKLGYLVGTGQLASDLPDLTVRHLGPFQITRGGQILRVPVSRKAVGVFRYLLTQRCYAADKDALIEIFWPQSTPEQAAHSLHVAVSTLRQFLGPRGNNYLLYDAGQYSINPDAPVAVDSREFQYLSDAGERHWQHGDIDRAYDAYVNAVDWYQGDFYVDRNDLAWAIAERERLLTRYLLSLDRLGRILMLRGQCEPALEYYIRLIERDGYREDAHYQAIRCYLQLGRRREALRQYQQCAEILATDLALEPAPELVALYRSIMRADPQEAFEA